MKGTRKRKVSEHLFFTLYFSSLLRTLFTEVACMGSDIKMISYWRQMDDTCSGLVRRGLKPKYTFIFEPHEALNPRKTRSIRCAQHLGWKCWRTPILWKWCGMGDVELPSHLDNKEPLLACFRVKWNKIQFTGNSLLLHTSISKLCYVYTRTYPGRFGIARYMIKVDKSFKSIINLSCSYHSRYLSIKFLIIPSIIVSNE